MSEFTPNQEEILHDIMFSSINIRYETLKELFRIENILRKKWGIEEEEEQ